LIFREHENFSFNFFFGMTKKKPNCPRCQQCTFTKTSGGGSHGKYRYVCEQCDLSWSQTPPHRLNPKLFTPDFWEKDIVISKHSSTTRSNSYKCGKCGKTKKGHVCDASTKKAIVSNQIANVLSRSAFQPPSTALLQPGNDIPMPFSDFGE
jgi:ribosomal protein S27AE